MTVRWWVTLPVSIVTLMVLFILRRDLILQICNSLTHGKLLHVNHANMFATPLVVTINENHNIYMLIIKILKNSDQFVRMLKQFTHWQTEVDNDRTAFQVCCDTINIKIDLPKDAGSNLWAGISLAQLTAVQVMNEMNMRYNGRLTLGGLFS